MSLNPAQGGVLDTTLCDKVCQWLATGRCLSPGTPVSFSNKSDRHNFAEILLKVALATINQPNQPHSYIIYICPQDMFRHYAFINDCLSQNDMAVLFTLVFCYTVVRCTLYSQVDGFLGFRHIHSFKCQIKARNTDVFHDFFILSFRWIWFHVYIHILTG